MSLMKFFQRRKADGKSADEGRADLQAMESASGGAAAPGIASPEAVEAAEAELDQYEAPSE